MPPGRLGLARARASVRQSRARRWETIQRFPVNRPETFAGRARKRLVGDGGFLLRRFCRLQRVRASSTNGRGFHGAWMRQRGGVSRTFVAHPIGSADDAEAAERSLFRQLSEPCCHNRGADAWDEMSGTSEDMRSEMSWSNRLMAPPRAVAEGRGVPDCRSGLPGAASAPNRTHHCGLCWTQDFIADNYVK